MSDLGPEPAARVQQALDEVAAAVPNLQILSIRISRGWGDVAFVRVEARLRGDADRGSLEVRLRGALARALAPGRSSVSVTWRR